LSIAASPAMFNLSAEAAQDALNYTREMYEITEGENNLYQIPSLISAELNRD